MDEGANIKSCTEESSRITIGRNMAERKSLRPYLLHCANHLFHNILSGIEVEPQRN